MKRLALAVLLAILAVPLAAQQLYTQPWLDNDDDGPYSYSGQQIADQFVLGSTSQVGSVEWYGSYDNAPPADGSTVAVTIRFFNDVSNAPDLNPFYELNTTVTANVVGTAAQGGALYRFTASLAALPYPTLTGGTPYWISILSGGSFRWQNGTSTGTANVVRNADGAGWSSVGGTNREQSAYTLYGPAAAAAPAVPALTPTLLGALAALLAIAGAFAIRSLH